MSDMVHIAGVLVQTIPARAGATGDLVAAMPGADVHTRDCSGKLVVVCECSRAEDVLTLIARIRDLPGVIDVALVYQHAESAGEMAREIEQDAGQET